MYLINAINFQLLINFHEIKESRFQVSRLLTEFCNICYENFFFLINETNFLFHFLKLV